jgi:predicted Co/Zn/Cd cation transporter (cation efflux family)
MLMPAESLDESARNNERQVGEQLFVSLHYVCPGQISMGCVDSFDRLLEEIAVALAVLDEHQQQLQRRFHHEPVL